MPTYLEVTVSLSEVSPLIWRRLALLETSTFEDLHEAIQSASGWQNYHLFAFREAKRRKAIAGIPDDVYGSPDPDAATVKVSTWLGAARSKTCVYLYDFGDSWEHTVRVQRKEHAERFSRRLLDGARAFPPEDSGGTPGYERYCSIVLEGKDPYGEPVEESLGWLGDWHPDRFDLESAKAKFDRPRRSAAAGSSAKKVRSTKPGTPETKSSRRRSSPSS